MARPGYIEARGKYYTAQENLDDAKRRLEEINRPGYMVGSGTPQGLPPAMLEIRKAEAQKSIEKYQAEFIEAQRDFAPFQRKGKARTYYPDKFLISVSVSRTLGNAIREAQDQGVPLAELV